MHIQSQLVAIVKRQTAVILVPEQKWFCGTGQPDIVFLTFGVILHKSRIEKMPNSLQLQEKNNSMILTMECFFVYLFFEKTFDFSVVFS